MRKTFITAAVVGVVGFGSAIFGDTVHADEMSNIEDQRSDIKDDLSEADAEIADIVIDVEEKNDEITRVEDTLKENKKKDTKENINDANDEIDDLDGEIDELENEIEERYDILKERAVSYQKNGGDVGFQDFLLGSENFNEFVSRSSAVSKVTDSDEELMKEQESDKAEVEEKQSGAEDKLAELEDMKVELDGMEDTILAQKDEKESSKKELKKKKKKLKDKKDDLEIEDSELASLEDDIQEQMEAAEETSSSDSDGELAALGDEQSKDNDDSNDKDDSHDKNDSNDKTDTNNDSSGSSDVETAINAGDKFIGNSTYGLGSMDPDNGRFDCSGFVSWSYDQAGYDLPRNTDGLASTGSKVDADDMEPGDLVFFDTYKKNGHVGIYMGDGEFIGSQTSTGVDVADMDDSYWKDNFEGHIRRVQ